MKLRSIFMDMIFIFIFLIVIVYVLDNFCGCNTGKVEGKMKKAAKIMDGFTSDMKDKLMNR